MVLKSGRKYTKQVNSSHLASPLGRYLSLTTKISMGILTISTLLLSGCEQGATETLGLNSSELETSSIDPIELGFDSLGQGSSTQGNQTNSITLPISCRNDIIVSAYKNRKSSVQVKGCGRVTAILSDDVEGSRHQRFIVTLDDTAPEHTVLIAHNIDIAPRVAALAQGDDVVFYGEYEYNAQGGVVHWTHHDPAARHQAGWIERNNKRYQ